jgi:uncharacterized protein
MIAEHDVILTTTDGVRLEARARPSPRIGASVVICHPHPLYGGDMANPVVLRAAEVCADHGAATLRFNFRSVGRSTGAHGAGVAERRDIEAAIEHVGRLCPPPSTVGLIGYSFGAVVAAHVAAAIPVGGLALIAPPLGPGDREEELPRPPLPDARLMLVAGDRDSFCAARAVTRVRASWPHADVRIIDDADHFFVGRLGPLGDALGDWVERLIAPLESGEPRGRGRAR